MAHRAGFVVPNATDTNILGNRQAEPDAGDFSVVGNDNYGVLTGFNFTITPGSGIFAVNTASGINVCVIDGDIYTHRQPPEPSLTHDLTGGGQNDRFDLVLYTPLSTANNKLTLLVGAENIRPKFPEIPTNALLIASIFVPKGVAFTDLSMLNVVDKRRWLLNGARGAVELPDVFLENRVGGVDPTFKVLGSGITAIGSDSGPQVTLKPYDAGGPKFDIIGELDNTGTATEIMFKTTKVTVQGNLVVTGNVTAGGTLTGSNLLSGNLDGTPPAGVGHTGSLYQDTQNGRVYIKMISGHWAEIAKDEYPTGTLIASLLPSDKAQEFLSGSWLICNGQAIIDGVTRYPNLAYAFKDWVHGNDLHLPDLQDCFLGSMGSEKVGTFAGANSTVILPNQLPPHKHFGDVESRTLAAGGHSHSARTRTDPAGGHSHGMPHGGQHAHHINDPLHVHIGADHGLGTFSNFIHQRWGGQFVVDMHPADAGHGTVVDISNRTLPAYTGINATANDGLHSHTIAAEPAHDHALNLAAENPHTHALPSEDPVGESRPIDNRPRFIGVNWYVKA